MKIHIKSYEDVEATYTGGSNCPFDEVGFVDDMTRMCGNTYSVAHIDSIGIYFGGYTWDIRWVDYMIFSPSDFTPVMLGKINQYFKPKDPSASTQSRYERDLEEIRSSYLGVTATIPQHTLNIENLWAPDISITRRSTLTTHRET